MARRSRKKPIDHTPQPGRESRLSKLPAGLLVSLLITAICAGIPFGVGKYIEFNSPGPYDSGAFVYSSKHLLDGAQLGVDEKSSARPNTLLANVIGVKLFGFNDTGPKIVQMLLQLAAGAFLFYTLRKVFGLPASVIGTTLAAVYLSAPIIAKFGNVKEQFMIPFMIAAACCYCLYGLTQKRFWLVICGFMALQPYFFKPTGMSIVVAIVFYIVIGNALSRQWKNLILESGLFLAGYAGGLVVPGMLFVWQKQPAAIFTTFPAVAIQTGILLTVAAFALIWGLSHLKKHGLSLKRFKISKAVWLSGLVLLILVSAYSILIVRNESGFQDGDMDSYVRSIPLVAFPAKVCAAISGQFDKLLAAAGLGSGYVSGSRASIEFSKYAPKIMRYYKVVGVPILLASVTILAAVIIWLVKLLKKTKPDAIQSKLVWLLAIWWILDMAFVWVSPRSYEQYYLPLCGSAAVLAGFIVWLWSEKLKAAAVKIPWLIGGGVCVFVLAMLSMPIFIGQRYSPDTGADYTQNNGTRRRGFGPALKELDYRKQGNWVAAGDYIRSHSTETDTMYVWGWVPGIYVQAQRLAPVPKAYDGDMHVTTPRQLDRKIQGIVLELEQNPPKFIVDSRKRHFPFDRPPLELWPMVPAKVFGNKKPRLLRNNPAEVKAFDKFWKNILETQVEPDEAKRYEAMKPLRDFVMNNYRVVKPFGSHVLFEKK